MPLPEQFRGFNFRVCLLPLLMLAALLSAAVGVKNGLGHSQDFQWSGAHILAAHGDPWAVYLSGDPDHLIRKDQIPNYLPVLYVMLFPLGLLSAAHADMAWIGCNLIFAVASGWIAATIYGMSRRGSVVIVCLLLLSTAARNSIGNGQQSLLILALWCTALLWVRKNAVNPEWMGLSFCKFSFAPPVFLYLWFRWGYRAALLSLVPAVAAIGVVWVAVRGQQGLQGFLRIATEPFAVARTGFRPLAGDQDVMSAMHGVLSRWSPGNQLLIEFAIAYCVCTAVSYYAFRVHRDRDAGWQVALMATLSFVLFKHHAYDGVVLLLPLCHALRNWRRGQAKMVVGIICYLFYIQRGLEAAHLHPHSMHFVETAMLVGVLALTYRLHEPHSVPVAIPVTRIESDMVPSGSLAA